MSKQDDRATLAQSNTVIELPPREAERRLTSGAVLVDIREDAERELGMPAGAIGLRGRLLRQRADVLLPDHDREILVICGTGRRSRLAVDTLQSMGYTHAASIIGGFERWCREGLPQEGGLGDADADERYARQMCLPQVGVAGQARLEAASVVIVGAGGLGSPVALYLAGAGVGRLSLIDDDCVERSNLHRQVMHMDMRIGMPKVESARTALNALNPRVRIEARNGHLDAVHADDWLAGHDLIIDAADNFTTRYLLSDASQRLRQPLVYGAVERFAGLASVFDPRRADSPCYRCLFPHPPDAGDTLNCSEAGVLGVLPGLVGMIQATEALKLLLGIGKPLIGRLLRIDALSMRFHEMSLTRNPECPGCGAAADSGEGSKPI